MLFDDGGRWTTAEAASLTQRLRKASQKYNRNLKFVCDADTDMSGIGSQPGLNVDVASDAYSTLRQQLVTNFDVMLKQNLLMRAN